MLDDNENPGAVTLGSSIPHSGFELHLEKWRNN